MQISLQCLEKKFVNNTSGKLLLIVTMLRASPLVGKKSSHSQRISPTEVKNYRETKSTVHHKL